MRSNNNNSFFAAVLFIALVLDNTHAETSKPSDIMQEAAINVWRSKPQDVAVSEEALTETDSPTGEVKKDWEPKDDDGELPVTGWSDALSGRLDSKTSCAHIRDEISVAEERFKVNTKRSMEELYGAGSVVAMEAALQQQKASLDDSLRRSGCFMQDPNVASISTFAVWREDPQGNEACEALFKKRAAVAATFQDKVRRMMLAKQPKAFTDSVDQLFSVTKSLHMRLQAQGCEGAPPPATATVNVPPAEMYVPMSSQGEQN